MVIPPVDHECALTPVVVELSNQVAKLTHELAQLRKAQFGPRTERTKMPRMGSRSGLGLTTIPGRAVAALMTFAPPPAACRATLQSAINQG